MTGTSQRFVLTSACPDQMGIVADVSAFLVERACNITESAQFEDPASGQFFMRTVVGPKGEQ